MNNRLSSSPSPQPPPPRPPSSLGGAEERQGDAPRSAGGLVVGLRMSGSKIVYVYLEYSWVLYRPLLQSIMIFALLGVNDFSPVHPPRFPP